MNEETAKQLSAELDSLDPGAALNATLHIDTFRHPYLQFPEKFVWPAIHTDGITDDQAEELMAILIPGIPGFLAKCDLLATPKPRKNSSQLQFVRALEFGTIRYIYQFRVSAEYMGGALNDEVLMKHAQGVTPRFLTDRIYFTARIIPVVGIRKEYDRILDFEPLQIKEAIFRVTPVELERDIWSTILFDEVDFSSVNQHFTEMFRFGDAIWKPGRLFFPFAIDFVTLTANNLMPQADTLMKFTEMYNELLGCFLDDRSFETIPEKVKNYWKRYYESWEFERIFSRGGNPHWVCRQFPAEL